MSVLGAALSSHTNEIGAICQSVLGFLFCFFSVFLGVVYCLAITDLIFYNLSSVALLELGLAVITTYKRRTQV